MFYDQAKIFVKAGDGGNGIVAFRREKYVPRGGPFGGNGGRGGNIYLVVDPDLNTLFSFRNQVHYRADRGSHGGGANKTGAHGEDLHLAVPPGTLVRDAETGEILADLTQEGQEMIIAQGGRGGRGNTAFKSARNNAPRIAEKGEAGVELWLEMELKLVADVGIVGVPNAGKSTLLSVISAAKPKIADYPFTTITPNLGVAEVAHKQIVVVDIPGLLEGAHEGTGLGHTFLRHVERTRLLIHLLNGDSPDPLGDYEAINQEMILFNPILAERPQLVVFNKMDLPDAQAKWPAVMAAIQTAGMPVLAISAVTKENVPQMLYQVQEMLDALPSRAEILADLKTDMDEEMVEFTPEEDERTFQIHELEPGVWQVKGVAIERAAQMTNWDYYEAAMRFQRILNAMGITESLRDAGVREGHSVVIGEKELVWGFENAFGE
ncbi:MAG: GTPase ObgE [Caldilineaceae bacterium]|nr:GTPase ObgE [Caldilineaceae bacterium]MBP8125062.1 GTPase ObgE [Caldilineaceae bacterium]MBP9070999.1 GTPase ObgE [Caldilineaceae bacterium]